MAKSTTLTVSDSSAFNIGAKIIFPIHHGKLKRLWYFLTFRGLPVDDGWKVTGISGNTLDIEPWA
jgi:hypothetical protein